MIRRDFLKKSAAVAGGLAFEYTYAAPCPPDLDGAINSSCGIGSAPPGAAPNWFLDMADNTWSTPTTNTIASVGGTDADICNAWTGGCVSQDRGELILAANGGHTDYSGNEVYACQIRQESPAWVLLSEKSTNTGGTDTTNSQGAYPDGKPRSVHGWSHCSFARGKVWYLGMTGMYPNGNQSSAVWSYDREVVGDSYPTTSAASPWTYHGLGVPNGRSWGSNIDWQSSSTAYDKATRKLWSSCTFTVNNPRYPFFSVDADTGVITEYPGATDTFGSTDTLKHSISVIVDSVWIIIAPDSGGKIWLLDLNDPEGGMVSRSTSGSPTGYISGGGPGAVYHQASNAILVYDHRWGGSLRKLAIPSNKFSGSWVWSTVSGGGETPGGQSAGFRGVYSKFNIIEDMGNGQSALVAALNVGGPVFVYKLPVAGV